MLFKGENKKAFKKKNKLDHHLQRLAMFLQSFCVEAFTQSFSFEAVKPRSPLAVHKVESIIQGVEGGAEHCTLEPKWHAEHETSQNNM